MTAYEDYAGAEGDPIECDRRERALLLFALEHMAKVPGRWVAHNGPRFDFPILRLRALKYGLRDLAATIPHNKWGDDCDDTHAMAGGRNVTGIGLDRLAHFFGVQGKLAGMSGGQVYPTWKAGDHGLAVDYCAADVLALQGVHARLKGVA